MHRATTPRLIWLCALLFLGGCERDQHLVEQHLLEFGTIIQVTMISDDLVRAESLLAGVEQKLGQQRRQWHAWEDSDLTRFNLALQNGETVEIPGSLAPLLRLSHEYHAASKGLFNPALGKLVAAYGFHGGGTDAQEIARIRLDVPDMRDLRVVDGQARSDNPDLQIDLGGIAKGFAVDRAISVLKQAGVESAIVSAGGDSRILGDHAGRPRVIGIRHPRKDGEYAAMIPLADTAISTSGDYERFFIEDGVRFHHILNPRTGLPAGQVQSVSVLAPEAIDSDALSTTCFVLGVEDGLALVNSLETVEAIFIDSEGKLHYSHGLLQQDQP